MTALAIDSRMLVVSLAAIFLISVSVRVEQIGLRFFVLV
jgi:hypothetical protein